MTAVYHNAPDGATPTTQQPPAVDPAIAAQAARRVKSFHVEVTPGDDFPGELFLTLSHGGPNRQVVRLLPDEARLVINALREALTATHGSEAAE